jgi:hypothetical protein
VLNTPKKQLDLCWRKSRISTHSLLRQERERLTVRDVRLGRMLAEDPGVTPPLIDQARLARQKWSAIG